MFEINFWFFFVEYLETEAGCDVIPALRPPHLADDVLVVVTPVTGQAEEPSHGEHIRAGDSPEASVPQRARGGGQEGGVVRGGLHDVTICPHAGFFFQLTIFANL